MALTKVTSGLTDLDGGITIDNITIDGTTISQAGSSDLTIDVGGRIDLSADDNGEIRLFDGSSMYAQFKDDSDRLTIQGLISDADILIVVNDGGSATTALTIDASEAGAATFNRTVSVGAGPATAGAVGTYALLWRTDSGSGYAFGGTLAGSNLKPANTYHNGGYSNFGYGSTSVSGTWRCMGETGVYNGGTAYNATIWMGCTVWVRIS